MGDVVIGEVAHRLAWVLVHSLWQAPSIAAMMWLVLKRLPGRLAEVRYLTALGSLLLVVLAGSATWAVLGLDSATTVDVVAGAASPTDVETDAMPLMPAEVTSVADGAGEPLPADRVTHPAGDGQSGPRWTSWFVAVWLAGVAIMLMRTLRAHASARRLVVDAGPVTDPALLGAVAEISASLQLGRRVQILVCDRLRVSAVVGMIWPVLLLPPAILSGTPVEQLRVVIAHELAHIRRCDWMVNLLQTLVEALLFFNPAVWWISRQIRLEREVCCDVLAAKATEGRVAVARTLVALADRLDGDEPPEVAAAWARRDVSLLVRVRRMLTPAERPWLRLPWYLLAGGLAAGLVLLVGLTWSADVAVEAVAELLTPKQRVTRIEQLQQTHGPHYDQTDSPEGRITLAGTVRTADGQPLPEGFCILATTESGPETGRRIANHSVSVGPLGSFEYDLQYGRVHIRTAAEGYAPTFAGPFDTDPGGRIEDLQFVLDRGFPARIRFCDPQGQPIPQVRLRGGYFHGLSLMWTETSESDESGEMVIEHATGDVPLQAEVRAPGFQFDRRELALAPNATVEWTLPPAAPTTGRVLDRQTGRPLPGAQVQLIGRRGFANTGTDDPRDGGLRLPVFTTDTQGRFLLDSLRDDCRYALYVKAPEHRVALIQGVTAGRKDMTIPLGPPLYARGRIVGDLGTLSTCRRSGEDQPYITWRNPIRFEDGIYNAYQTYPIEVRDGVGHFVLDELLPGRLWISAGDQSVEMEITHSIDDLVIDLGAQQDPHKAQPATTREVILRLNPPRGNPTPHGEIRVDYMRPGNRRNYHVNTETIEDGKVSLDVPVPGRILYKPHQLVGYWFAEKEWVAVPAGDGPYVIDIPVRPVGAIYGRVLDPDGEPAWQANVSVMIIDRPQDDPAYFRPDSVQPDTRTGRFLITPLLLDGRYRIVARSGKSGDEATAVSEELTVNAERPIRQIDLRLVRGVPLHGTIEDPQGGPAQTQVSLTWESPFRHDFGSLAVMTDRHGQFRLERVDPDLPGRYYLTVQPTPTLAGRRVDVKPDDGPVRIRLAQGKSLTGVVIDAKTGWPIPNAKVTAIPRGRVEGGYEMKVETYTDDRGRFTFSNLEARTYQLWLDGAVSDWPKVYGGQKAQVTLRVRLTPGSTLHPARLRN